MPESLVFLDVKGLLVNVVIQVTKDPMGFKGRKVFVESQEHQDLAHQVSQALGVPLVIQDRGGVMEIRAALEVQVHLEEKVHQGHLV